MILKLRVQTTGKPQRIHPYRFKRQGQTFSVLTNKAHIKLCIVCHQNATFRKFQKRRQHGINGISIGYHRIGNRGQLRYTRRDGAIGIDKFRKFADFNSFFIAYGTDFDNGFGIAGKARGLQVKDRKGLRVFLDRNVIGIGQDGQRVVQQLRLISIENLYVTPLCRLRYERIGL